MAKNIKNKNLVHYDKQSDVLYFGICEGVEEEFSEIAPGIAVELDKKGNVIGVEVLNASRVLKSVLGHRGAGFKNEDFHASVRAVR